MQRGWATPELLFGLGQSQKRVFGHPSAGSSVCCVVWSVLSSTGSRECSRAERGPSGGSIGRHSSGDVGDWDGQTAGGHSTAKVASPHSGEHAAPHGRNTGESWLAERSLQNRERSISNQFVIYSDCSCLGWLHPVGAGQQDCQLAGGQRVSKTRFTLCASEQKDEEEVRRRIASITYSDPLYWDRPGPSGMPAERPSQVSTNTPLKQLRVRSVSLPLGGDSAVGV